MDEPVLVVGANGLLGSNVLAACLDRGLRVVGTYHSTAPGFDVPLDQLDLTDTATVRDRLDAVDPGPVINCAAMTDVDACEEAPEQAHAVNAAAPTALAEACRERDSGLVHVSTDYVFDGRDGDPYSETAEPNPIQVYGESKLLGERGVLETHPEALVPRLSFVYGLHRTDGSLTGFPAWVRGRLDAGETVPLFTDQRVTPTRAGQAAPALLDLIGAESSGRIHVAARSCVTPYEFGEEIASVMGITDPSFTESSQADVDRAAARPANTCLDVSRVETRLDRPQPTLGEDLSAIAEAFMST